MLFNLLLASILILCFFFLFLVFNFFMIPIKIDNARLKLSFLSPTDAPMTVANDAMEMFPVIIDKTINYLSKQ